MLKPVTLHDGHDNFFTPIRFFLASMVVFGHAYGVALRDTTLEPRLFFQYQGSWIAVNLFFIASGYLVTKSMLYRKDAASYSSARILRIYPALIVHVLFVMLIIGAFTTSLSLGQYFSHPDFWKQPLEVLTFRETDMVLPGVFESNDEQSASAALWTLRYEILAYIGTLIAFWLGLLKHKWMIAAQFVLFAVALPVAHITGIFETLPATLQSLLRFGVAYGLGAAVFAYQDKIKFYVWMIPVLFGLSALCSSTPFFEVTFNIALAYLLFWMAYVKAPALNFLRSPNDLSYGIYIYHWCILQVIFMRNPQLNAFSLFAITFVITILLSYASWHLVEKPALGLKKRFADRLRIKKKAKS